MINRMNIKLCFILFGALIVLAVHSPDEKTKKKSFSKDTISEKLRQSVYDDLKGKRKARQNQKAKKSNSNTMKKANRMEQKRQKKQKNHEKENREKKQRRQKKQKKQKRLKKLKKMKEKNSAIPESCLKDSVQVLYNGLAKKASNFDRQVKRIEKRVPIIANKLAKAGDYIQAANNMANIIPSCPDDLVFAAEELSLELGTCEAKITDSCQPPILYNQTKIDECKIVVEAFKKETEECINLTNDLSPSGSILACGCWESEILKNLYDDLADCNIIEMNKNVTDRFKECKGSVSDCNKAETDSFPVYVNCSNNAQTIDDLEEEAKLLANNINALYQALTAVMKAASLTRRRIIRVATTNCSDYIGLVKKRELFLNKCLNII